MSPVSNRDGSGSVPQLTTAGFGIMWRGDVPRTIGVLSFFVLFGASVLPRTGEFEREDEATAAWASLGYTYGTAGLIIELGMSGVFRNRETGIESVGMLPHAS